MSIIAQELGNFPVFLAAWLTFFAAAIFTYAIQLRVRGATLSLRGFADHIFPFEHWKGGSTHMDAKIFVIRKLTDRLLRGVGLACLLLVATRLGAMLTGEFAHHVAHKPTVVAVVLCSVAMFVVSEFADWLTHMLQHKIPALWELHKVHHSALFLNPLTAQRGHPLAYVFERAVNGIFTGVPAGIFAFVYELSVPEILFLALCAMNLGLVVTLDGLKHSHFPVDFGVFDKLLVSPHMHQVHHSSLEHHWDRNYGVNLSIFDWMFGTAYQPRRGERIVYGISGMTPEDHAPYNTLYGSYVTPVVRMGQSAALARAKAPEYKRII